MAISITYTIKNTFLDTSRQTESSVQRCNSVPRTFKPGTSVCGGSSRSDESTSASDTEENHIVAVSSECDSQDYPDYCTDYSDDESDFLCQVAGTGLKDNKVKLSLADMAAEEPVDSNSKKVTLSLADMVSERARQKLRSQAKPFKSARTPPAEVTTVIKAAAEVLSSCSGIVDVQVQDGGMGGTTMIVGKSSNPNPDGRMSLALIKDTLLNSAAQTDNTYILAYGAQPFNNLDSLSFSANIASVPAAHQGNECWDSYEFGLCARHSTCRWSHPSETDKMRIIVMIQKAA